MSLSFTHQTLRKINYLPCVSKTNAKSCLCSNFALFWCGLWKNCVKRWFLLAFLLGKFQLMSAWPLTFAKHAEFGTGLENNVGNTTGQCRLAVFPEYIWHFKDLFFPWTIVVIHSLVSIAAFKYWWKQIMVSESLGLKKHPRAVE